MLIIHENGKKEIFYDRLSGKRKKFEWKNFERFIKGKNVEVDAKNMSAAHYIKIEKKARKVLDVSEELFVNRMVKKPEEVAKIKKASKIAKEIVLEIGGGAKQGMREIEIEKMLRMKALEKNVELAFEPIVAADENSATPHTTAGNKKLRGVLLIDFGVRYEHYCSDISQVFFFENKKAKGEYEKIENVFYEIADELDGCKTGGDVHTLHLRLFKKLKIKKMPHSIGHGIGLEVHEFPRLKKGSTDTVAGSVIALEPAVYHAGRYGLRFEREVWVGKNPIML